MTSGLTVGVHTGLLKAVPTDITPDEARTTLAKEGLLLKGFGADIRELTRFATQLGTIGDNYRLASGVLDGSGEESFPFNVVKVKPPREGTMLLHEKGGGLRLHTARSWAKIRPKYFMLVMVDPGWRGYETGRNGEALYAPWRAALRRLAAARPSDFPHLLAALQAPISFRADNVKEEVSTAPIVYPLPDPQDEFDYGVRMKQDLVAALQRQDVGVSKTLIEAITALQDEATVLARESMFPLEAGDLVIIDNIRWGHGRCDLVSAREDDPRSLNPREVWSWTVS